MEHRILSSSLYSAVFYISFNVSLFRNQAKPLDAKEEAARAAAKAEKEKKDAMANIDINNYASLYMFCCSIDRPF